LTACAAPDLGAGQSVESLQRHEESRTLMGTEFRIVLYSPNERAAQEGLRAAWSRIEELDSELSDYDATSELSQLSRRSDGGAPTEWIRPSRDLLHVLRQAQTISAATDGAFDVTVGPYVRLWRRAERQAELPSPERLARARESVGFQALEFFDEHDSIRLTKANMRLDLGGIAKGYALDEALEILEAVGIQRALVDGGGDIAVSGPPPGRAGWSIELDSGTEPTDAGERSRIVLELAHAAVATSGDTARYIELNGVRYSHVVDPRTGLGSTSGTSASVIAPNGMLADACASAACVLGVERGSLWLEAFPGVEGRLLTREKGMSGPCETSGFRQRMSAPPGR